MISLCYLLSEDAVIVKEIGLQIDPERIAINHHAVFVHPFVVKKISVPKYSGFFRNMMIVIGLFLYEL